MTETGGAGARALKIVLFANTDWYLYNFRLSLARALVKNGHAVLLMSPPGPYGEKLRALGYEWQAIDMVRRSLNPLVELVLLAKLTRLFRREAPDLVHGFTLKCAVYGALAARLAGVKAQVSAVAGLGYVFISDAPRARLLREPIRRLLRLALGGAGGRLVVQNQADYEQFVGAGVVREASAHLIPGSGVDCKRFQPCARPRRPGPLRVLLATRLLWDKGVREFAEAAERLTADGRTIEFILAGEPDPGNPASIRPEVAQAWADRGVLRWVGHVEDMPALLVDADVVVLPSYREGLSKALIEAAACGKAIVTTDVPGCRDVVEHEVSGLLVPARQAAPLASAIARLDDDRDLIRRYGAAARQRAERSFAEPVIVAQTLDVYAAALSGLPAKPAQPCWNSSER